jgi:hypothetical protein
MKLLAASLVTLVACSQHLYSPPTQAYQVAPVHTLDSSDRAVDIDASTHSQIFDPGFDAASGRLRAGIGNNAEVSLEGMGAMINSDTVSTANRNIYAGRGGFRINPDRGPVSFTAGLGGGYAPAAGGFAAVDGGVSVGFDNCYVVPVASASLFASQPLSARAVDVTVDSDKPMTSTPSRTAGATFRGGFRISLSPSSCHAGHQVPWITAGLDFTTLVDASSDAELLGLGAGLTVPL